MSDPATPPPVAAAPKEDTTVAIIGYLTGIGLLVATILHGQKPTSFAAFHLRQMLGLMTTLGLCGVVLAIPLLGLFVYGALCLVAVVFWFIAFMGAINGEKKLLPVVGAAYQDLFKGAFVNG